MAPSSSRSRGVTRLGRPPAGGRGGASVTIRVDFGPHGALGPGKVRLMELVGRHGSITAAGKAMGMSYRRAWLLIDGLNRVFAAPLVAAQHGGALGGGASLTELGATIMKHYRAIERRTAAGATLHLKALERALAKKPPKR